MKITARLLKRKGACADEAELFEKLYPDGAEITEAACVAVADKFDWDWAAENLLPAPLFADYATKSVWIATGYESKCEWIAADYWAGWASLYAAHGYWSKYAPTPLDADYRVENALLDAVWRTKRASLDADYETALAALFGRLAETVAN